ncbi:hypothetical protein BDR26DRAFT_869394 [Obelidium mucronatum]|nr:hypothetical protein BDR26DRAFT_869394 [Obelidium mucronatum]
MASDTATDATKPQTFEQDTFQNEPLILSDSPASRFVDPRSIFPVTEKAVSSDVVVANDNFTEATEQQTFEVTQLQNTHLLLSDSILRVIQLPAALQAATLKQEETSYPPTSEKGRHCDLDHIVSCDIIPSESDSRYQSDQPLLQMYHLSDTDITNVNNDVTTTQPTTELLEFECLQNLANDGSATKMEENTQAIENATTKTCNEAENRDSSDELDGLKPVEVRNMVMDFLPAPNNDASHETLDQVHLEVLSVNEEDVSMSLIGSELEKQKCAAPIEEEETAHFHIDTEIGCEVGVNVEEPCVGALSAFGEPEGQALFMEKEPVSVEECYESLDDIKAVGQKDLPDDSAGSLMNVFSLDCELSEPATILDAPCAHNNEKESLSNDCVREIDAQSTQSVAQSPLVIYIAPECVVNTETNGRINGDLPLVNDSDMNSLEDVCKTLQPGISKTPKSLQSGFCNSLDKQASAVVLPKLAFTTELDEIKTDSLVSFIPLCTGGSTPTQMQPQQFDFEGVVASSVDSPSSFGTSPQMISHDFVFVEPTAASNESLANESQMAIVNPDVLGSQLSPQCTFEEVHDDLHSALLPSPSVFFESSSLMICDYNSSNQVPQNETPMSGNTVKRAGERFQLAENEDPTVERPQNPQADEEALQFDCRVQKIDANLQASDLSVDEIKSVDLMNELDLQDADVVVNHDLCSDIPLRDSRSLEDQSHDTMHQFEAKTILANPTLHKKPIRKPFKAPKFVSKEDSPHAPPAHADIRNDTTPVTELSKAEKATIPRKTTIRAFKPPTRIDALITAPSLELPKGQNSIINLQVKPQFDANSTQTMPQNKKQIDSIKDTNLLIQQQQQNPPRIDAASFGLTPKQFRAHLESHPDIQSLVFLRAQLERKLKGLVEAKEKILGAERLSKSEEGEKIRDLCLKWKKACRDGIVELRDLAGPRVRIYGQDYGRTDTGNAALLDGGYIAGGGDGGGIPNLQGASKRRNRGGDQSTRKKARLNEKNKKEDNADEDEDEDAAGWSNFVKRMGVGCVVETGDISSEDEEMDDGTEEAITKESDQLDGGYHVLDSIDNSAVRSVREFRDGDQWNLKDLGINIGMDVTEYGMYNSDEDCFDD